MSVKVGQIQAYDVFYVPEKDMVFCKNTCVSLNEIRAAIFSSLNREYIESKDLSVVKDQGAVYLGCLTTTIDNILSIQREIKKIKSGR